MKMRALVLFLLTSITLLGCSSEGVIEEQGSELLTPIEELMVRRFGEDQIDRIRLEIDTNDSANVWHEVSVNDNLISIKGSSKVAVMRGAYNYLHDQGYYYFGWDGERRSFPNKYQDSYITRINNPFAYRPYLNVCAFGYSTPWWGWDRWEQEIDFMMFRGINMPLAMEGQEYVWRELWSEFGLTSEEISRHFSGPAFLPWHRMGNIESHDGPLPNHWIDAKHKLQVKILDRMLELGMEPVTPAFAGYVPKSFQEKFPQANIRKMESWSGFEGTYWLDPSDPLFAKLSKRFLKIYEDTYGETKFHLADAFNEITPAVNNDQKNKDLARYGETIFKSIRAADPDGVWVMQGWQFGHSQDFWTTDAVEAFLSKIPNNSVMIHDIGNDRYPVWRNLDAFGGKSWAYGVIHNYGATDPLYGDFDFYQKEFNELNISSDVKNLDGFGVFPEGIEQNGIIYDYIFDLPWEGAGQDWSHWMKNFLSARYGEVTDSVLATWIDLKDQQYRYRYWSPRWKYGAGTYMYQKRPTLEISDFEGHPGNLGALETAIKVLLNESAHYRSEPLYEYDLIEITRHYLSQRIDLLLVETVKHYELRKFAEGDNTLKRANELAKSLDMMLSWQPGRRLDDWLVAASKWASTDSERSYFVENAKRQITLWGGGHLKDYASKSWNGMIESFYIARWNLFLEEYKSATLADRPFSETEVRMRLADWEGEWVRQPWSFQEISSHEVPSVLELISKATQND